VGFLVCKVLTRLACQPPRCLCVNDNSVEFVGIESSASDVQKGVLVAIIKGFKITSGVIEFLGVIGLVIFSKSINNLEVSPVIAWRKNLFAKLCNPLYFPLPLSYLFIPIVAYLPPLSLSGLVVHPCRGVATRLRY
jgi:hypothetical protein